MEKEMLISALIERGWYHQESFMTPEFCSELLSEANNFDWKQAQVGKGTQRQEALTIRNDSIYWINETNESPAQKLYLHKMNDLMNTLNQELYLNLKEFECHFARYDVNGFYKKHLDQHVGSSARSISTVFYLNEPLVGGELVIYKKENHEEVEVKIRPRAGSFVCFLSNQIYHEVSPTQSERFSITGWFRTSVS